MPEKRIDIAFVLPTLVAGGAERIVSFVAQQLDKEQFNATLIITAHEKDAAYDIKGIPVIFFEKERVLKAIPMLYNYIKKNKPDIVLSAVGHLNTVTAFLSPFFPKTKFAAREVNVLSVLATFDEKRFDPFALLSKKRFNRFDKIVCQSQDMLDDLNKHHKIKQEKLIVINNPITTGFNVKEKRAKNEISQYITVARLVKQKGHERIINMLSKVEFPFHYTIIGDGSQKDHLFKLLKDFGFEDKVTHIPFTKDVAGFLAKSDVYLQGSYVEGFPNALIESCVVGTPVVAFNAPGGLNEIIEEGINGYIVEDEKAFIEKLNILRTNERIEPSVVSNSVFKKYNKDIIIKKYEDLFNQLVIK